MTPVVPHFHAEAVAMAVCLPVMTRFIVQAVATAAPLVLLERRQPVRVY